MKITKEIDLEDFEFWGEGRELAKLLDSSDFSTIENYLNDVYPEGLDEVDLNDIFSFEEEHIATILGYHDYEEMLKDKQTEEEEEE
jgi:hypothetical protein